MNIHLKAQSDFSALLIFWGKGVHQAAKSCLFVAPWNILLPFNAKQNDYL